MKILMSEFLLDGIMLNLIIRKIMLAMEALHIIEEVDMCLMRNIRTYWG